MSGWASSGRRTELPSDWPARVDATRERAGGRCEARSQITDWGKTYAHGTRCERPGSECDHRSDRDDHDDLQWLCTPHHRRKTQKESAAGREARKVPKRAAEEHPGRIR